MVFLGFTQGVPQIKSLFRDGSGHSANTKRVRQLGAQVMRIMYISEDQLKIHVYLTINVQHPSSNPLW